MRHLQYQGDGIIVFEREIEDGNSFGIYRITNIVNGKHYIGQTKQRFKKRFWLHQWKLRNGCHDNAHLQRAWEKYGDESFEFCAVRICSEDDDLNELEKYYITEFDAYSSGYNMTTGGDGKPGCPMPEEARRIVGGKNRQHNLGRKLSAETRERMSKASRHLPMSDRTKAIVSAYMSNRVVSDETKAKIAQANQGSKSTFAKIDEDAALEIKRRLMNNEISGDIAKTLGISRGIVYSIKNNHTWTHVKLEGWDEWVATHSPHK